MPVRCSSGGEPILERLDRDESVTPIPRRDAAACAAIYAPHVEERRHLLRGAAARRGGDGGADRGAYRRPTPGWSPKRRGEVAGYAYACRIARGPAYRWSVDVSVYVAADQPGPGLGRRLYEELFERLREQRFRIACAGITLPNPASVALHESLGFEPIGVYREIGWKAGAWRDVGWWQLRPAAGRRAARRPSRAEPAAWPGYHAAMSDEPQAAAPPTSRKSSPRRTSTRRSRRSSTPSSASTSSPSASSTTSRSRKRTSTSPSP